jgi:hypothetical protein
MFAFEALLQSPEQALRDASQVFPSDPANFAEASSPLEVILALL